VLHRLFAPASARAVDLARWGHQQPGMPWELERSLDYAESFSSSQTLIND
jgi:hypothetical protein